MKKSIMLFLVGSLVCGVAEKVSAESAQELQRKSLRSLHRLYEQNSKAQTLGEKAFAVLVFPDVVKAGFLVAAQRGDGVLYLNGQVAGYYNMTSAGYGLQAGVQKLNYALFFMDEDSMKYLKQSDGFDIGAAPSLVLANDGIGGSMSVASMQHGIAAFIWGQKGLMGGIGLQGTKITKYHPSE